MKSRKSAVYFALALTFGALASACGKSDDVKVIEGDASVTVQSAQQASEAEGYVFSYKGTAIPVDADAAPILEKLGEPLSYFESESCAAQGIGKLYTYGDFEIETYPDGDTDRILYVMLKSDAVSTQEGISLANTKDEVKAVYGEPDEEKTGAVNYHVGEMTLKFIFDGDAMVSIEYDSPKN